MFAVGRGHMIVCICNRLNESQCRDAAQSGRCLGVSCVYRLYGCQPRCGRCLPRMRELLANHAPEEQLGARGLGCSQAAGKLAVNG